MTIMIPREHLIRKAVVLQWATITWMIVEASVAVSCGVAAHSTSLLAFGTDSLIELISAILVLWRLSVELRHGRALSESAERIATRIGGALLFVLAFYVVASAGWSLLHRQGESFSTPGLVVSVLAIPTMYFLARRKLALAELLGSRSLRTDAMESITCGWLSVVVVIGLTTQLLTGAWWVDPVTSLAIVYFLIKEGREAWSGEPCRSCK